MNPGVARRGGGGKGQGKAIWVFLQSSRGGGKADLSIAWVE